MGKTADLYEKFLRSGGSGRQALDDVIASLVEPQLQQEMAEEKRKLDAEIKAAETAGAKMAVPDAVKEIDNRYKNLKDREVKKSGLSFAEE